MKPMNLQMDNSHRGTIATMIFAFFGWIDVNTASQLVFMTATLVTGTLTSIYTYKKIKYLNDENNSEKS